MWRESLTKQATMMDTLSRMREQLKLKQSETAERFVHLQGLISDSELKIASL